jgi:hypothetical protein
MKLNFVSIMEKDYNYSKTYIFVIRENLIQTIKMCRRLCVLCHLSLIYNFRKAEELNFEVC